MQTHARQVLCAAAPLGTAAFWGGLAMAARRYPSEYDWRYMTISSLVYPDRNPGYLWAWSGLVLCGLGGLCWMAVLARNGTPSNAPDRPVAIWALGLGYLCMVGCVLLPGRLLHLPRSHDLLALAAFVGLCVGTVQLTYHVAERRLRRARSPRIYAGALAGAAMLPLLLVSATQAYVSHALPQLPWVGLEWRARGVPVYLSFAFWEWVTCAVFSVYTTALSRATRR